MREISYSHSKIRSYIDCPRLFYWQYIQELEPKVKPKPLAAGSTIAEALETYRSTGDPQKVLKTIKEVGSNEENQLALSLDEDPQRSVANLTIIMLAYMQHYPDEYDKIVKHTYKDEDGSEKLRTEIEFKLPLLGANNTLFSYEGRIDGLYLVQPNELAIIEDKTTSRLGDKYFDQYQANHQVMWYMWAANELGAFKDSIPRCIVNAIYINSKETRFKRQMIMKSIKQLQEAKHDLIDWIRTIEQAKATSCFPRNLNHCEMWGGCPFKVLRDIQKESLQERIIEANFKEKKKEKK